MKQWLVITVILFSTSGFSYALDSLPNGHWKGRGEARMQSGEKAAYLEDAVIQGNVLTNELQIGAQKESYATQATFGPNGFLTLAITDQKAGTTEKGTGYCASIWCHWQSQSGKFEMTIVFDGDKIYELGSDTDQGHHGWFESKLIKVGQ